MKFAYYSTVSLALTVSTLSSLAVKCRTSAQIQIADTAHELSAGYFVLGQEGPSPSMKPVGGLYRSAISMCLGSHGATCQARTVVAL
jgi:hypothetical protein